MLMTSKLCVSHGNVPILNHLSLEVKPGALTVLLGRNGVGKSTLLKVLAGDLHQQARPRGTQISGSATLNGEALSAIAPQQLAQCRAVLPQASQPTFPFRVEEIVQLGRYPHSASGIGPTADRSIVTQALQAAGADGLAGRVITTLSGGELARVQFARVLAQLWPDQTGHQLAGAAPRYLLLDEPTAMLDLAHQHHLLATVRELTRTWHIGALAIVHDPNLAARHADAIALLAHGRIIAQGTPSEMMRADLIEQCYGFVVRMLDGGSTSAAIAIPA